MNHLAANIIGVPIHYRHMSYLKRHVPSNSPILPPCRSALCSNVGLAFAVSFLAGLFAAVAGPNIKAIMLNVNDPAVRGVALALQVREGQAGGAATSHPSPRSWLCLRVMRRPLVPATLCTLPCSYKDIESHDMRGAICKVLARLSLRPPSSQPVPSPLPIAPALHPLHPRA